MKIKSLNSKVLWCLISGVICVNAAHFMCIPFLAFYLINQINCSLWITGLVIGVGPFFSILGGFIGGQLSDKLGRLPLLYMSVFATAVLLILFYIVFSVQLSVMQLFIITILNALLGFFTSFFQPSVMALMTDWIEPSIREQAFQLRYAAINIGAIAGPLLGVFLGTSLSPIPFLIAGLIYLSYGGILFTVLKNKNKDVNQNHTNSSTILDSINLVVMDRRLLNFILFHIFFAICYSQITSTLAFHINQNMVDSKFVYSMVIAINATCVLLGQIPIYLLCKNRPKNQIILYGCLIFSLGCIGFSYSGKESFYFYCSTILITLGELLIFPFASGIIDTMAPAHLKGTYFGALSFRELGLALGPILGSALFQIYGGQFLFLFIGALALFSYYFVLKCMKSNELLMNQIRFNKEKSI